MSTEVNPPPRKPICKCHMSKQPKKACALADVFLEDAVLRAPFALCVMPSVSRCKAVDMARVYPFGIQNWTCARNIGQRGSCFNMSIPCFNTSFRKAILQLSGWINLPGPNHWDTFPMWDTYIMYFPAFFQPICFPDLLPTPTPDPRSLVPEDSCLQSPLHVAQRSACRLLLDFRADLELRDFHGRRPLHLAGAEARALGGMGWVDRWGVHAAPVPYQYIGVHFIALRCIALDTRIHTYTHTHTYMHTCIHANMHTCIHVPLSDGAQRPLTGSP